MCIWLDFTYLKNMFIDLWERGRKREKHVCEKHWSVASHAFPNRGNQTGNLGMCPDQESDPQPFGAWDDGPTNWATLARAVCGFKKLINTCPGWRGSVDWVLAYEPESRWFDSQSGHMPGLRMPGPQLGVCKRRPHIDVSPSLSPSLPSLQKINK